MYIRAQYSPHNSHICYVKPLRDTNRPAIQIFNVILWQPFLRLTQQLDDVWPSTIRVIAVAGDDRRKLNNKFANRLSKKTKRKEPIIKVFR